MLNLQIFFTNFNELVERLAIRGISKNKLLIIRKKLIRKKELIEIINPLRKERNKLIREGIKTKQKVEKINEEITDLEKELDNLASKINDLTDQLPNLPASDTPTNQKGNKIVDNIDYPHNIQHNLTHEQILKKLKIIDEEKSILLSGSKFTVYQGLGSKLLHALINFMRKENNRRGY